jgi:hypothetical protein
MRFVSFLVLLSSLGASGSAHAYIGPGLGLGTIGVLLGILLSIVLAVVAVFWYPLKRLLGLGKKSGVRRKAGNHPSEQVGKQNGDV